MSNVQFKRVTELSSDDIQAWRALLADDPSLATPFFHPAYTQAIARHQTDVDVAIFEEGEAPRGFLPFHRARGIARPVGKKLTDFQGVVGAFPAGWTAEQVLRRCALSAWHFDHLPATQQHFVDWSFKSSDSAYLDLSGGWPAYCRRRNQQGSKVITQAARKARKLEREAGPLRFEVHIDDDRVFEQLIAWKSAQRERTGSFDVLRVDWARDVLDDLRRCQSQEFASELTALFVGDRLIAAHFGLRTSCVLHFWFAAYNPDFAKYSPGLLLILRMAEAAAGRGIQRIDLGKGEEGFKSRLASGHVSLLEGAVDCYPLRRGARAMWRQGKILLRSTPLGGALRTPKRLLDRVAMS